MYFQEYKPDNSLSHFIESYWLVKSDTSDIFEQKIIPDGCPEIIYHFEDNYEIKLFEKWEYQDDYLFSGQISNHFYLRNTGKINMLGIKLKPWSPSKLFNLDMSLFTDSVKSARLLINHEMDELASVLCSIDTSSFSPEKIDNFFIALVGSVKSDPEKIDLIVNEINKNDGQVTIDSISKKFKLSRRSLERQFLKHIGLTPKYYSRIIRFNAIFKKMQINDISWCQIAYDSGYYDQAHFIKEFKKFSGEIPSKYGFDENTFANFFLNR